MLNRCIFWILTIFCLFFAHTVRAESIGSILEIEGTVTVTRPGEAAHTAALKEDIGAQDVIATGPKSKAYILLVDDTEFTLSENAKFEVADYEFNPDDNTNNAARYSVFDGAFRYVSGLVAKKPSPDVEISTPVGSIGIRGTDFSGGMDESGDYGIYVDEGAVNVKNDAGEALLKQGQGTTARGRGFAPRTPFAWDKSRIDSIHTRMAVNRQKIQQRREEMKGRRQEQLQQFKAHREERMEKRKQRMEQLKQNRQQQNDKRQDKIQQLKENREGKQEERKEKFEQLKQNREGQQDERQQKLEQLKQNRQGQNEQRQDKIQQYKDAYQGQQQQRQEKIEQFKQDQQGKAAERQQKIEEYKQAHQAQTEQRQEKMTELKDKLQEAKENRQERTETLKEKIARWKKEHPGRGEPSTADLGDNAQQQPAAQQQGQAHPLQERLQQLRQRRQ